MGKILADYCSWHSYCSLSVDSVPDAKYDVPEFYCPYHNLDTAAYPISPFAYSSVHDNISLENEDEENPDDVEDLIDPEIISDPGEAGQNTGKPHDEKPENKPDDEKPGKEEPENKPEVEPDTNDPEDEFIDPEVVPEMDENTGADNSTGAESSD